MKAKNLFSKVHKTIKKYEMFSNKDKILVAVSGGIDSMTLLTLLMRTCPKERLAVIHINHKLRGKESDRDAEFVRKFCLKNNLSFYLVELDLKKKSEKISSKQDCYREKRLSQIISVAKKENFNVVFLAHTLSDQVETFFMRLFRGTGPSGLVGIQPKNIYRDIRFVRPLIEITREEIEELAKENSVEWREDSTNKEDIYLRNSIRFNLIPIIKEKFGVDIEQKIGHLTTLLREDEEFLDTITRLMLSHFVNDLDNPRKLILNDTDKVDYTILRRIVRLWIMQFTKSFYSPDFSKIETICKIIRERKIGKIVSIDKNLHFILKRNYGLLMEKFPEEKPTKKFCVKLKNFMDKKISDIGYEIHFRIFKGSDVVDMKQKNKLKEYFNYEKIKLLITIRNRKAGDRFQPLGMKDSVKLKDFFINEKIPVEKRDAIPIFESNGKIFWVAGLRIDERFKVNENTKKILMIELKKISGRHSGDKDNLTTKNTKKG